MADAPPADRVLARAAAIPADQQRVFLNPAIIERMRGDRSEQQEAYFQALRERVDGYPDAVEVTDAMLEGTYLRENSSPNRDWGRPASNAALVYLVTQDEHYLDKALNLLEAAAASYVLRFENDRAVSWYAFTRVSALAAYDWLYPYMDDERRKVIGEDLALHMKMMPEKMRSIREEGSNLPEKGFYGSAMLPWYAGLTFVNRGIADDMAHEWLKQGYHDHVDMFEYRSELAGTDGGSSTPTITYAGGEYYLAEYNFFYSWKSAFGTEFSDLYTSLAYLPNWLYWSLIEGRDGQFYHYGTGEVFRTDDNQFTPRAAYLAEFGNFYSESAPDMVTLAHYLLSRRPSLDYANAYLRESGAPRHTQTFIPLAYDLPSRRDLDDEEDRIQSLLSNMPKARHFPYLGQIFMNSERSPSGTYAIFMGGGEVGNHKTLDENNFVIYHRGFLAMNRGTRGGAGKNIPGMGAHERNFSNRTISRNAVLIFMEGEEFPPISDRYLGKSIVPEANDGGMQERTGAEILAYETNEHYTYIASDATAAYHPDKAKEVIRQFLFVYPDYFVIYDRVESKERDQPKRWILQTQNEPELDKNGFVTDHWDGRMFVRTVWPERAHYEKVGGEEERFWVDGENWEVPVSEHALVGNWRVEVESAEPDRREQYLHLLQVGGKEGMPAMVPFERIGDSRRHGVEFTTKDGRVVRVMFNPRGTVAGRITISDDSTEILRRPLRLGVQPQRGLAR